MATDLSSGNNGSVPAERSSFLTISQPGHSVSHSAEVAQAFPLQASQALSGGAQATGLSFEDIQAKAELAARMAANGPAAPDLTKKLAQLLAASISQTPTSPRTMMPARTDGGRSLGAAAFPGSAPAGSGKATNTDLASLAAIMAGAHTAGQPLPRLRDELAKLNYNRVPAPTLAQSLAQVPASAEPLVPAVTTGMDGTHRAQPAALEPHHDDEPMPIPSTWREKTPDDEDRPVMRQLGAAALGLVAGLVVVVPAVLWLVGWIGPQGLRWESAAATSRASDRVPFKIRPIEPPSESATFFSNETPGVASDPGPVTTASMARMPGPLPGPIDVSQQVEQVLVLARQKIESGDVAAARDMLGAEDVNTPAIAFALAETFDPNMLAAWNSRGVAADAQRARALYARALDMGFGRAMARLDALQ